jgi:hypothetical protein
MGAKWVVMISLFGPGILSLAMSQRLNATNFGKVNARAFMEWAQSIADDEQLCHAKEKMAKLDLAGTWVEEVGLTHVLKVPGSTTMSCPCCESKCRSLHCFGIHC